MRVVRGGVKPFAMVGVKLSYSKGRAARLRRRCPGSLLALPEKKKMVGDKIYRDGAWLYYYLRDSSTRFLFLTETVGV